MCVCVLDATLNDSDLKGLRAAWRSRQLVLFVGAGVSIPSGLPSWKNFVLELLFRAGGTHPPAVFVQAQISRMFNRITSKLFSCARRTIPEVPPGVSTPTSSSSATSTVRCGC